MISATQRKWKISWTHDDRVMEAPSSSGARSKHSTNHTALTKPPGFVSADSASIEATMMTAEAALQAKQRQVMSIAYSPGQSLLSTAFMLWMSGSSIQIFSIMATGMALINPLKAMVSTNQVFSKFSKEEGLDVRFPKLIYVALQLLSVGLALYKCSTMGLLPVTSADWTSLLPEKHFMEVATLPVKL